MKYDREQLEAMPDHQLARLANRMAGCEYEVRCIHTGARRAVADEDLANRFGVGSVSGTPLFRHDILDGDGMLRLMEWCRAKGNMWPTVEVNDGPYSVHFWHDRGNGYIGVEHTSAPRALAIAALLAGEEK